MDGILLLVLAVGDPQPGAPGGQAEPQSQAKPQVSCLFVGRYDRNGDAKLEISELPHKLASKFTRTDANRDGFLDAAEILYARTAIGRQAREMEGLELEDGRLEPEGRAGEIVLGLGLGVLHQIDQDVDGYVDSREIMRGVRQPGRILGPLLEAARMAAEGSLAEPGEGTEPKAAPATPSTETPADGSKSAPTEGSQPSIGEDGLPTGQAILRNLDKNRNGVVDRDEAVDRLAENFTMIDRDKSGGLDPQEIDRALRLARLFGIKPQLDPRTYRSKDASPSPAPAPSGQPAPAPRPSSGYL